jgi:hypothetical protein
LQAGCKLVAMNLSNQSDSGDLLGGYKPVQAAAALAPLAAEFAALMRDTWPQGRNEEFLARVARFAKARNWAKLLKAFDAAIAKVLPCFALRCPHSPDTDLVALDRLAAGETLTVASPAIVDAWPCCRVPHPGAALAPCGLHHASTCRSGTLR